MSKTFAERNPVRLGVTGTAVLIALLVLAFTYDEIPGWPGRSTVIAEFADASGLGTGDSVQIAGIEVGEVDSIELAGDHVDITLEIDPHGRVLGDRTTAAIKVETALGRRYVELRPGGDGPDLARIPVARTTAGFDLTESLNQLTGRLEKTDKAGLADAVDSVSAVFEALPDDLRSSLDGVSRLSTTISSRDAEVRDLLVQARSVTGVLAERNDNLIALLTQGGSLFAALQDRAQVIRNLLLEVRTISDELRALVEENTATTGPMLAELERVTALLTTNYDNINAAITGLRPYVTQLGEAVASGPFFGALLQNIAPANLNGQQPGSPGQAGGPR